MQSFDVAVDRRPRGIGSSALANPAAAAKTGHDVVGGVWQPTRLLDGDGRFLLCRARCAGELGPGCYVLKRLRLGGAAVDLRLAELRREAAVAAAINHPQLVSVLAADLVNDQPYILLPYLEGTSVQQLLAVLACDCGARGGGRLPIHAALAIARQIASALTALHQTGWLHGQVSLRHIVRSPQGHATLIDLTRARQLSSPETRLEAPPRFADHYTAPEFFRSGTLTAAADVYALGATLFQMLAGQPPFASCADPELAAAHTCRRPPDLRQLRPDATLEVAKLVSRTLAKEPLRRPTADQLINWLAALEIAELTRAAN